LGNFYRVSRIDSNEPDLNPPNITSLLLEMLSMKKVCSEELLISIKSRFGKMGGNLMGRIEGLLN